jgi:predicted RNA-binding Zn-ribbon protein involved in translation (DUF1610 family)
MSDDAMSVFTISADGKSITCHTCGLTCHNLNDIAQRYCGRCHPFLDPPDVYEFDCRECGRHIVSLCDPCRVDVCAMSRSMPGWFRDPKLARRLDPAYAAEAAPETSK